CDGMGYILDSQRFQLPWPRFAYADRLYRPADRDAAHCLRGDAGDHRGADETVFRASGASAADSVTAALPRGYAVIGPAAKWFGQPSATKISPRSASSASRHSTSRRMTPPPENVMVTMPAGASCASNSTASRLSCAFLFA